MCVYMCVYIPAHAYVYGSQKSTFSVSETYPPYVLRQVSLLLAWSLPIRLGRLVSEPQSWVDK